LLLVALLLLLGLSRERGERAAELQVIHTLSKAGAGRAGAEEVNMMPESAVLQCIDAHSMQDTRRL
jgi:hypothetical protein